MRRAPFCLFNQPFYNRSFCSIHGIHFIICIQKHFHLFTIRVRCTALYCHFTQWNVKSSYLLYSIWLFIISGNRHNTKNAGDTNNVEIKLYWLIRSCNSNNKNRSTVQNQIQRYRFQKQWFNTNPARSFALDYRHCDFWTGKRFMIRSCVKISIGCVTSLWKIVYVIYYSIMNILHRNIWNGNDCLIRFGAVYVNA